MIGVLRKAAFAVPFGCLVAVATHAVRFGDDHAFGGDANEGLVALAVGGSIALSLVILHAFLAAGTTTPTGSVAALRIRRLLPGPVALFALAGGVYYGIEALEGHGPEFGLPTLLLALLALAVSYGLDRLTAFFAGFVSGIVKNWLALLGRREHLLWHRALRPQPAHAQVLGAARHLGRAPPNGRRHF